MGDPAFPVQMIGLPASPGKNKDHRPLVTFVEGRFVDGAKFFLAEHDSEERSRRENRQKFHEVLATEVRLALGGEGQDAIVTPDNLGLEHGIHQGRHRRRVHLTECRNRINPAEPLRLPNPSLLEDQSHQLLGQDVVRLFRGMDGLHKAILPEGE